MQSPWPSRGSSPDTDALNIPRVCRPRGYIQGIRRVRMFGRCSDLCQSTQGPYASRRVPQPRTGPKRPKRIITRDHVRDRVHATIVHSPHTVHTASTHPSQSSHFSDLSQGPVTPFFPAVILAFLLYLEKTRTKLGQQRTRTTTTIQ